MTKYMDIGGRSFRVIKPRKDKPILHKQCAGCDLYKYYKNPSSEKKAAYNYWKKWADNCDNVLNFGVCSGNTFTFSIRALYMNTETGEIEGVIHITPCYNTIYIV